MSIAQRPLATGHAVKFRDEGGEDAKPTAMPLPDANTNKSYRGRAGTLKAGRPMNLGGNAARPRIRSRRRK